MGNGDEPNDGLGGALQVAVRRLRSEPLLFVIAVIIVLAITAVAGLAYETWNPLLIVIALLAASGLIVYVIVDTSHDTEHDTEDARLNPGTETQPAKPAVPMESTAPLHRAGSTSQARWDPRLNEVVRSLADALPNEDEIISIARATPLSLMRIRRSPRADIFWHGVVERARLEGRVEDLLDLAVSHAEDPNLLAAVQRYRESG